MDTRGDNKSVVRKAALLYLTSDLIKLVELIEHCDAACDRQLSLLMDGSDWLVKRLERNKNAV